MMLSTTATATATPVAETAHRYRVVVADPNVASRKVAVESVASLACFEVVAQCSTGADAVGAIRRYKPELLVVDVNTPTLDGFSVVSAVRQELPEAAMPAVIFLTSNEAHALKAFELRAVDCMMRPFSRERLLVALQRAKMFIAQREMEDVQHKLQGILHILGDGNISASTSTDDPGRDDWIRRIGIRTGDRWSVVQACEIDWIGAAGVYAKIAVGENSFLLRASLSELERRLDPGRFVRIHRSTIVNITRVSEIRLHGHGEYVLVLTDGTSLKASRSYAERVRDAVDKLG